MPCTRKMCGHAKFTIRRKPHRRSIWTEENRADARESQIVWQCEPNSIYSFRMISDMHVNCSIIATAEGNWQIKVIISPIWLSVIWSMVDIGWDINTIWTVSNANQSDQTQVVCELHIYFQLNCNAISVCIALCKKNQDSWKL